MDNNDIRRRVDKLERSLNPRQAIILAMESAISRFDSLVDCAAWLANNPDQRLLGDHGKCCPILAKD